MMLAPGEFLLLQLSKVDADSRGMQNGWTNFVLVLDRIEEDPDTIKQLWPDVKSEDHDWHWLLYGSHTIPTIPFSTNDPVFDLSQSYSKRGLSNPAVSIKKEDVEKIAPYILGALAEEPDLAHQHIPISQIVQKFGKQRALLAIHNHDHIVSLRAKSRSMANREKHEPNPYLTEILASYYEHRCQVCGKDCSSASYSVAFSETYYIQGLDSGSGTTWSGCEQKYCDTLPGSPPHYSGDKC
jgi:hypothetical protein